MSAPTASMAEAAVCSLIAIAMVHIDNRVTPIIIMMIFATGVPASVFLIFSHDRPFVGWVPVGPDAHCRLCLGQKPLILRLTRRRTGDVR